MARILSHCHPAPKGQFEKLAPRAGLDGTVEELARCTCDLGTATSLVTGHWSLVTDNW